MRKIAMIALVASAVTLAVSAQQPADQPDWSARLAHLDPARPKAYFELGEEIADAATNEHERELARTLFGLAGTLDRDALARSSALALASLSSDSRRRRSLTAVASLLGRPNAALDGDAALDQSDRRPTAAAAVALSEAFAFYRRGQGPRALGIVKGAEVDALLARYGAGTAGGAERFREDCRAYKGGLRPDPGRDARTAMLAIEESLLAAAAGDGRAREWSSVLIETAGRPLIEIDSARLDEAFGVDPSKPWWRDGRWSASK